MSKAINLKNTIGKYALLAYLCNLQLFADIFVRKVLTGLLIFLILLKIDIHVRYTMMHV